MQIDPATTIGRLLAAIPSSAAVFSRLRIQVSGEDENTLQDLCAQHAIPIEVFLKELNEIDWGAEFDTSTDSNPAKPVQH